MTLIIPDVKELEQMVPAGGQQPVPVLVPLAVHHRVLVRVNGGQHLDNSNNNSSLTQAENLRVRLMRAQRAKGREVRIH